MKATCTWMDHQGCEMVALGEHHFGFGDIGDGYCYRHQSFACIDHLTAEEHRVPLKAGGPAADE